ncbi:MAG: ABC transporter permease [Rhodobacteraceae bacterium]|nr:ABC transporter permease [Paracoccaceae bacterium]
MSGRSNTDGGGTEIPEAESGVTRIPSWVLNLISAGVAIALWFVIGALGIRGIPSPFEVLQAGINAAQKGLLWTDMLASFRRVTLGLILGVLVAIPTAFIMGWYRVARAIVEPWIQFLRTVPPIALIPLVIVLFGIGETPKVMIIFFAAFMTSVISIYQGVVDTDRTLINAARVLGATDRQVFLKVVVPAAMPFVFVGVRIALAASWGTLIASELVAAQEGLGYRMQIAGIYFDLPTIYFNILVIGLIGYAMDRLLQASEGRLIGWQERK